VFVLTPPCWRSKCGGVQLNMYAVISGDELRFHLGFSHRRSHDRCLFCCTVLFACCSLHSISLPPTKMPGGKSTVGWFQHDSHKIPFGSFRRAPALTIVTNPLCRSAAALLHNRKLNSTAVPSSSYHNSETVLQGAS
jgi:hypothetical protein